MKQTQEGGDHSVNVQASGDINMVTGGGLTAAEVIAIAEYVVKQNLKELAATANETMVLRTTDFAEQLAKRLAPILDRIEDALANPDVQYAISDAGIGYARKGTQELSDILLDLVTERITANDGSLMATVLSDAIKVLPRLTKAQISILATKWYLQYVIHKGIPSIDVLISMQSPTLQKFGPSLPKTEGAYLHLQALGCIAIAQVGGAHLPTVWRPEYSGLFTRGFALDSVPANLTELIGDQRIFQPLVEAGKFRIVGQNAEWIDSLHLPEDKLISINQLRQQHEMNNSELMTEVSSRMPEVEHFERAWPLMQKVTLSAVGIAIAHAVHKKNFGSAPDLAYWINED